MEMPSNEGAFEIKVVLTAKSINQGFLKKILLWTSTVSNLFCEA